MVGGGKGRLDFGGVEREMEGLGDGVRGVENGEVEEEGGLMGLKGGEGD